MYFAQRLLKEVPCDVMLFDPASVEEFAPQRLVVPLDLATSTQAYRHIMTVARDIGTVVPLHIAPDFAST